jgi:hypothetical protein
MDSRMVEALSDVMITIDGKKDEDYTDFFPEDCSVV